MRGERAQRRLTAAASHLLLLFFTLVIVYPVAWIALSFLKDQGYLLNHLRGLPRSLAWDNYTTAWKTAGLGQALFNSVVVSLSTVVLVIAVASPAGYALARFRFRFSTAIFLLFILTMQAPVPVIPLYVLLVK